MMADSIEHVISYWVMFQKFQSPALAASPSCRTGCRSCSSRSTSGRSPIASTRAASSRSAWCCSCACRSRWGVLFLTDTLEMWHAMVLLVIHGIAGVLWLPAAQLC